MSCCRCSSRSPLNQLLQSATLQAQLQVPQKQKDPFDPKTMTDPLAAREARGFEPMRAATAAGTGSVLDISA